ncbi:MAG: DUF2723 domain-containing protein [Deltaproteobacteria bacterium]|nr:DUF2723 domain-containing protein [Deltaproteobacteria bacterium]
MTAEQTADESVIAEQIQPQNNTDSAAVSAPRVSPGPPWTWAAIATLVPTLVAVLLAGDGAGWLDSPELATSAQGLGITHPPGHPLWVILGALACGLIPVGSAAFRLTILSAALLGLLGRATYELTFRLSRDLGGGGVSPRIRATLALSASLSATLGPTAMRQATRPEVYALAALLAIAPIALLTVRGISPSVRARLAFGIAALGLANHHFIAITAMPALGATFVRHVKRVGPRRAVVPLSIALVSALSLYALLPLRAHARASLPRPQNLAEILEVASARTFAKNTGAGVPQGAAERIADVLDTLSHGLTPFGILAGLMGLWLARRSRLTARLHAGRLVWVLVVGVIARAWLGFTRDNPDAAGYLLPASVALATLSAAFTAGSLKIIRDAPAAPQGPSRTMRVVLMVLLVALPTTLPLWHLPASWLASQEDRASAPTTLSLSPLASAPPRAVLLAHDPQTIFRLRYAQIVEGERPDVLVIPVPLLGYPGLVTEILRLDPGLAPVLTHYLLRPERAIRAQDSVGLSTRRHVLVELHLDNLREYTPFVIPAGPFAIVLEAPSTLADVRAGGARHFARFDQLATQLDREGLATQRVQETLLWSAYVDALFFAARGARPEARRAIERAQARVPQARQLSALREALDRTPGDGPIDVTPFFAQP